MALLSDTAFKNDFGPQEVPKPEIPALSLSDWGTSRGPKSVLKAVSLKSAIYLLFYIFFFGASVKIRQPALSLSCVFIGFSDSMSETLQKKIRTVFIKHF